jgi:hypothetical protein
VNSGSSANLVAFSALTTHKLPAHKRIRPGDEVITVAAGFPTTVAPIIQCGAVPVFIDAKVQTGNANCALLEAAYAPGKTKAVMMAHALGNPFELVTVLEFCQKYDLWLIEDNCDALGCTYTLITSSKSPKKATTQSSKSTDQAATTKHKEPTTKNKEPTTKHKEPTTKNKEPTTKNKEQRTKHKKHLRCFSPLRREVSATSPRNPFTLRTT